MGKKKLWLISGAAALVLILGVILALILGPDPKPEEVQSLPKIGLCLRQFEQEPVDGQLLKEQLIQAGYSVTVRDAKNDQSRQTQQIADLLEEGIGLLVIEPVIADAAGETVSLLMEKNVPAVFVNYKPEEAVLQKWSKLSFVGSAEDQLGALQAKILLQTEKQGDLNEDGQISCLIISGPEDDAAAKRQSESFLNTLAQEGLLVQQVDTGWGEWTTDSGRIRCAKALSQHGRDIDVIVCGDGNTTLGALEALSGGGWQAGRDYYVIGADTQEGEHITGTVLRDGNEIARKVLAQVQLLQTEGTAGEQSYVNLISVTEETGSQ